MVEIWRDGVQNGRTIGGHNPTEEHAERESHVARGRYEETDERTGEEGKLNV